MEIQETISCCRMCGKKMTIEISGFHNLLYSSWTNILFHPAIFMPNISMVNNLLVPTFGWKEITF